MTHADYQQWLDLDLDGGTLPPAERRALVEHLAVCAACQSERRALERLRETLERSRMPVRSDFANQVMAALPQSGWESRPARAWVAPAALAAGLLAAAALLLGGGRVAASGAVLGTAAALADVFVSALVVGAGLAGASWRGLGMAIEELFAGSPGTLLVFAGGVLFLHLLFLLLLRRRPGRARARRLS